jgi:hypothetical protein
MVMTSVSQKFNVRILLIKEGSQWVAQCLEHDLAAQGPEIDDAIDAFATVLAAKIISDDRAGREPLSTCKPAPERYFMMAQRAKHIENPVPRRLPDEVPPTWGRVLEPELFVV